MSVNGVWKGDALVHGFNPGFKGMPGHVHHQKQPDKPEPVEATQPPLVVPSEKTAEINHIDTTVWIDFPGTPSQKTT